MSFIFTPIYHNNDYVKFTEEFPKGVLAFFWRYRRPSSDGSLVMQFFVHIYFA